MNEDKHPNLDDQFYVYKMTVDNGGAPCVHRGILSLAICKPAIRRCAPKGSWVFGFAATCLQVENPLIYVARVDERKCGEEYYSDEGRYKDRPGRIYHFQNGEYRWRSDARYHSQAHLEHDLGSKEKGYPNAHILWSSNYRYLGQKPLQIGGHDALHKLLMKLTQGARVNLDNDVKNCLIELSKEAFKRESSEAKTPTDDKGSCNSKSCDEGIATNDESCGC